jgi:DNA repair protein RadC
LLLSSSITKVGVMLIQFKENNLGIKNDASVADLLHSILRTESSIDRDKEHFWTIGLNTRNVVKYVDLTCLGTLNASLVHPREVFRLAIMKGVASIVIGHNHPSGDSEPSEEDIRLTRRLIEAGRILGIEVLDHIIIADNNHLSFKATGLI